MKTQSHLLWFALATGIAQCVPNTNNDIVARAPPGRHDEPQEWHERNFRLEAGKAGKMIPQDWARHARLSVRDRERDDSPRAEEHDGAEGPPPRRYGEDDDDGPRGGKGPRGGPQGRKAKPPHDRNEDEDEDEEDNNDDHQSRPDGHGRKNDNENNERPAPPHCYPGAPENNGYGPDRSSCTEDELQRAGASGQQWQDLEHPDDEHREERPAGGGGYLDKRQRYGGGGGDRDGSDGDDGGRDGIRNTAGRNTYPVLGGVVGVAAVMAAML